MGVKGKRIIWGITEINIHGVFLKKKKKRGRLGLLATLEHRILLFTKCSLSLKDLWTGRIIKVEYLFQKGLITLKSIDSRSMYFKTLEVDIKSDSVLEDENEQKIHTYAAASKKIGKWSKSSDRQPYCKFMEFIVSLELATSCSTAYLILTSCYV